MDIVLFLCYIGAVVCLLVLTSKYKKSLQALNKRIADLEEAIGGYYKSGRSEY